MAYFVEIVQLFIKYVNFPELYDWMQFDSDCVKLHHHVISGGLFST